MDQDALQRENRLLDIENADLHARISMLRERLARLERLRKAVGQYFETGDAMPMKLAYEAASD